jgi:hypothetical protein
VSGDLAGALAGVEHAAAPMVDSVDLTLDRLRLLSEEQGGRQVAPDMA